MVSQQGDASGLIESDEEVFIWVYGLKDSLFLGREKAEVSELSGAAEPTVRLIWGQSCLVSALFREGEASV